MPLWVAAAFNVETTESVWCYFSIGSTSALGLLGFPLTCWAYKTKFTAGGKL